jgi:hypothetical protein
VKKCGSKKVEHQQIYSSPSGIRVNYYLGNLRSEIKIRLKTN